MSDVTTEEIEKERERAHAIMDVPQRNACIGSIAALLIVYKHTPYCTRAATALATVRKEARREALGEAADKAKYAARFSKADAEVCDDIEAAIRALTEPGT